MKLKNPLLVVRDMERSKTFYREVLGLHVVMDFGANVTLTGGLCLQTLDTWTDFLGKEAEEIRFGANDSEVYFEEDDFDGFLAHLVGCADVVKKLERMPDIVSLGVVEHGWGQRVVRLYDPDRHIIEVGENMKSVCRRFRDQGMTPEQIAARMEVPLKFVTGCLR